MIVIPLQSGSKGNCYYFETATTKILIDAGITIRQATLRLQSHDRAIADVAAMFVTHDHSDHSRYVGDYARRFNLPVHLTARTLKQIDRNSKKGPVPNTACFRAGESVQIGDIQVHSIPTPHDAVDGVAYVIESNNQRIGVLTDLGHAFSGLKEVLQSLDAVIIESNYDESLLSSGPYPEFLKHRIRGDGGHLSNEDSAKLLHQSATARMQWACLCHLSDENNCPDTAIRTHQTWLGDDFPLFVAKRHQVSQLMKLDT